MLLNDGDEIKCSRGYVPTLHYKSMYIQDNYNFNPEAADTIQCSFYMDDCLKYVCMFVCNDSKSLPHIAWRLRLSSKHRAGSEADRSTKTNVRKRWIYSHQVREQQGRGHKIVTRSGQNRSMKSAELGRDTMAERALGAQWNFLDDEFKFKIKKQSKSTTRRGVLSATGSFDPLVLAAPVLMVPKLILQERCQLSLGWNDVIPMPLQQRWLPWHSSLNDLKRFSIERSMKPVNFGRLVSTQLHHFADASQSGYGAVAYLRQVDEDGRINCAFLIGKARVAPLKSVTIPHMKLAAATLAVRLDLTVKEELQEKIDSTTFWTDSSTVIRYVRNKASRYHAYVANCVGFILVNSEANSGNM